MNDHHTRAWEELRAAIEAPDWAARSEHLARALEHEINRFAGTGDAGPGASDPQPTAQQWPRQPGKNVVVPSSGVVAIGFLTQRDLVRLGPEFHRSLLATDDRTMSDLMAELNLVKPQTLDAAMARRLAALLERAARRG